jgi:hypothetical protein
MRDNPGVKFGAYPQTTARNQSQRGMSAPAVPPMHRACGMDGRNGPAVPYFPGSGAHIATSALSEKVRSSTRMPGASDGPPAARSGWSDAR